MVDSQNFLQQKNQEKTIMKIALVSVAPPYRGGISTHSAILFQHLIESHSVPCKRPSNCTFGGENLDILYVTTLEGHLFMVKNTGRQGYLLYPEK